MRYSIYEENMERLTKKMIRIQNKCAKYGCEFHFAEVGEEYKEIETGEYNIETGEPITEIRRFVIVEAEGKAIVNGWRFIASIDHTEAGNVINKAVDDAEVPERYYNNRPVCEHCGNKNVRYSFIVQNIETGEFKQVGRSCLKDFTFGMSAEGVAQYTAAFNDLIEGELPREGSGWSKLYIKKETFLNYVAECIRHFGYVKSASTERSTYSRAIDYYKVDCGGFRMSPKEYEKCKMEMWEVNFNAKSEEATKMAQDALTWVLEQEESNNYMHNLITVCKLEYVHDFGILASLFPTYNKDLEIQARRKAEEEQRKVSQYVGEVGARIEINAADWRVLTGWSTQWGYTCIYKIVDTDGNVYTWKTTNDIENRPIESIKATVKEHKDYNGEKQTELTRCKITYKVQKTA